jgi:ATP-dependent RNA helicase UAP56/SUB2
MLCERKSHTRELAFQIRNEYQPFSNSILDVSTSVFDGDAEIKENEKLLANKTTSPLAIVAPPGDLNALLSRCVGSSSHTAPRRHCSRLQKSRTLDFV